MVTIHPGATFHILPESLGSAALCSMCCSWTGARTWSPIPRIYSTARIQRWIIISVVCAAAEPVSSKIWSGQKLDRKKLVFLKNWFLFVCHFRFLKYFDNKLVFSFQFWLLSIFCFIIWVGLLKLGILKGRSDLAGFFKF